MPAWAWGLGSLFLACIVLVTLAVLAARDNNAPFDDRTFLRFVGFTLLKSVGAMLAVSILILMLLPADPA